MMNCQLFSHIVKYLQRWREPLLVLLLFIILALPGWLGLVASRYLWVFPGLLLLMATLGVWKKWYRQDVYFLWTGVSLFFSIHLIEILPISDLSPFDPLYYFGLYSWRHLSGRGYFPMPLLIGFLSAIFLLGLIRVLVRFFKISFRTILFSLATFYLFYWLCASMALINNENAMVLWLPDIRTMEDFFAKLFKTEIYLFTILFLFYLTSKYLLVRKKWLLFLTLVFVLFIGMNYDAILTMKNMVGYSFSIENNHGNYLQLLALLRMYGDVVWLRPLLTINSALLLLVLVFSSKRLFHVIRSRWQAGTTGSRRGILGRLIATITITLIMLIATLLVSLLLINTMSFSYHLQNFRNMKILSDLLEKYKDLILWGLAGIVFFFIVFRVICWIRKGQLKLNLILTNIQQIRFEWRQLLFAGACILLMMLVVWFSISGYKVNKNDWQLYDAVARGDLVQARNVIKQGANINVSLPYGGLLHLAAQRERTREYKMFVYLLDQGIDINRRNLAGERAIDFIYKDLPAYEDAKAIYDLLLKRGAILSKKSRD